jgi:hypothetical protein
MIQLTTFVMAAVLSASVDDVATKVQEFMKRRRATRHILSRKSP